MFCVNCGSNVADDVVLCPRCGKSAKGDDVVVATRSSLPLSNFTARAFRIFFEIILWFILISWGLIPRPSGRFKTYRNKIS